MSTSDCSEPILKAKSQIRDGERLTMGSRYDDAASAFYFAADECLSAARACEAMAREQQEREG